MVNKFAFAMHTACGTLTHPVGLILVELMKFDFRHVLPRAARRRGDNSSPSKTFQNRKAWQFEKKA